MSLYTGLDLVREESFYTFASLKGAPLYSLKGSTYLGANAIETLTASPGEVMRANRLIYNFQKDLVAPITSISQRVELIEASNYYLSHGLILPGSLTDRGKRVTDYAAWYLFSDGQFKYSEVTLD